MGKSNAATAASSSSWSGFFVGSAVTAATIFLIQNRESLYSLFVELSNEYKESDEEKKVLEEESRSVDVVERNSKRLMRASLAMSNKKDSEDHNRGLLADLIKELWPYINIAGSDTIRDTAEPMFKDMMPGPLSTLHFTKIDLGSVPISLDNVTVHEVDMESNTLQFDMDVVWDGNCDIKLKADFIGSFGVKSIKMRGRLAILLRPLVPTISIVSAVQYGFINKPEISLQYSGLANVANFKVIDDTIKNILVSSVNNMMVLPRRRLLKMDKGCDYTKIFKPPVGVARVTVQSGRGFVVEKGVLANDTPDCYCAVKLGDSSRKTHTIMDNLNPVWDETLDFLMYDNDQALIVECWDLDEHPLDADDFLGMTTTTPENIMLLGEEELPLHNSGLPTGAFVTLGCESLRFTSTLDSLENANANHLCGLLTIMVLGCFDIPLSKEEASTFVQVTCGKVGFATSAVMDRPGVDCLNPSYDKAFLVELTTDMITDGRVPNVCLDLMNGVDKKMGTLVFSHSDLVLAQDHTIAETRPIGTKGAKLQFRICLQGVAKPSQDEWNDDNDETFHMLTAEDGYGDLSDDVQRDLALKAHKGLRGTPKSALMDVLSAPNTAESFEYEHSPRNERSARGEGDVFSPALEYQTDESRPASASSNLIRVTAVGGKGFKVRKRPFFQPDDVPDIYLNITFGSNPQIWRTKTIKNNPSPVWNESKEFVLHSHGQVIDIEVFDADEGNKQTKDIHLGSVRITAGKVLLGNGTTTQEITREGKGTGAFLTIQCQLVQR